ncbi:MAG: 16S rRNA processing protein RimM [Myxococcales bacterium]|nr:16S rRNA processing protein RimM [Myxococcales bacterium]
MTTQSPELIELGFIAGPHGLHGECTIRVHNPNSPALATLNRLVLRTDTGSERQVQIEWVRPLSKGFGVGFRGVASREEAELLKGASVFAWRSDLGALKDDEVYLEDLRGYAAVTTTGTELGKIVAFMTTNIHILVIESTDGDELLIPALDDTFAEIDHTAKQVRLNVPDGLLEP